MENELSEDGDNKMIVNFVTKQIKGLLKALK